MNNSTFLLVGFIVFLISGSIAVSYLPEVFSEEEFNVTESHCNLSDNMCIEENLFTPIPNATETGEFFSSLPKYTVDLLDVYEILPTESDKTSLSDSYRFEIEIDEPIPIRRNLVEEYWNFCDTFFFNECYIVGAY